MSKFDFDSLYPPLSESESAVIRRKFYADWLRNTEQRPLTQKGFEKLVGVIEDVIGEWLTVSDNQEYDIVDEEDYENANE